MKLATFKAQCRRFHQFQVPLLSDMSYGEFLFSDSLGQSYKYYCSLEESHWNLVESILKQKLDVSSNELGDRIRQIIGLICDKEPDIKFYTDQIICPTCQSKLMKLNRDTRSGWAEIGDVTFQRFDNQLKLEQEKEIKKIIMTWR